MNKIKLLGLFIFFAILVVVVYFYFSSQPPSEIKLKILVLNNDYLRNPEHDSAFSRELTSLIMEKYNPTYLQIKIYGSSKLPKSEFEIKQKPGENEKIWREQIYRTLFSIFADTTDISLSNESTNDLFIDFLKKIQKEPHDPRLLFVLAGSFPNCYSYTSKKELLEKIKDFIKNNNQKPKPIYSFLINPRLGLEAEIIDSLKSSQNYIVEEVAIAPDIRRECFETKFPRFFGMFYKKLNYQQSADFLEFIKKTGGNQFIFTIWNDGPKNNTKLIYFDDKLDSADFVNILQGVQDANWTSVNFLFKQAYNELSLLPDSIIKHWIFVGRFPPEGDRASLDKDFWQNLKKIKNLLIYHYLPSGLTRNSYEKAFFNALEKYYGIRLVNQ
ncbi:MAG: hypothetical protein ACK42Z_00350 [Candidatus Kapaibacteriota bacterium]